MLFSCDVVYNSLRPEEIKFRKVFYFIYSFNLFYCYFCFFLSPKY